MSSPTLSHGRRNLLASKAARYAAALSTSTLAISYWSSRGFTQQAALDFGIGFVDEGQYQGRISIPYLTPSGLPWGIKYRCISDHNCKEDSGHEKYGSETGTGTHLYNAGVLAGTPDVVALCEGELDAVAVQSLAGIPAVAFPGAQTWRKQEHWPLCFDGIADVIVIPDGDKTGREAARVVAGSMSNARVAEMPEGMDANTYLAEHGAAEFRKLCEL